MATGSQLVAVTGLTHETVFPETFYLVERPDVWHAIVDVAVRRTGRRGRAGQPLLPHQRRQDRREPRLRTALGDLPRLCGGQPGAAVLARLVASHRRRAADRGSLHPSGMGKASPAQPDRDA